MSSGRTEPAPREARTDRTARRRSEPCATDSQALIGKTYNDEVEPPSHATEVPTGTTVVPQTSRAPPDQMRPTTPNMSRSGVPAIEPVRASSRTWTPTEGERAVRSALRRYSTSSSEPRLLANPSPTGYTVGSDSADVPTVGYERPRSTGGNAGGGPSRQRVVCDTAVGPGVRREGGRPGYRRGRNRSYASRSCVRRVTYPSVSSVAESSPADTS